MAPLNSLEVVRMPLNQQREGVDQVSLRPSSAALAVAAVLAAAAALSACGSSNSKSAKPSSLSVSIAESGKSAKFTAPSSIKGGLVALEVTNKGKRPHGAQLVLLKGGHTAQQALKVIGSDSNKTPAWLRGEGGLGTVAPGQTARATLNLPAGRYVLADAGGPGSSGPPAYGELTAKGGKTGSLPSTPTTITAANPAKDKYDWKVSGPLKAGANRVTFDSKGKGAIHLIGAFRVKGNPSKAALLKALKSNGKPPGFVDPSSFTTSAVIDGGKSQVTPVDLQKPGKYVLFCPLSDRDGGKPHFEEGMLKTVTVK